MNSHARLSVLLASLLVLSAVAMVVPASAGGTTALDEGTALTEDSVIEEYESEGVATASETVPDVTFTVADRSEDVDVEGLRHTNFDRTYLRIEYEESIERTLRVYIPREYWHPHPDELQAINNEDVTATLEPVPGGDFTAVTVHFEGQADVVFPVKGQASVVFSARDSATEWLENETDIDLPAANGEQDQWEYVPTSELAENQSTIAVDTHGEDVTLQYDAEGTADPSAQRFRTIPDCTSSAGGSAPVCQYEAEDDPDRVHVLLRSSEPPDIRYKHNAGLLADATSSFGELGDIVAQVRADARDLVDSLLS